MLSLLSGWAAEQVVSATHSGASPAHPMLLQIQRGPSLPGAFSVLPYLTRSC